MQTSEDGFAARAAKLFGSLEGHGAPAGGWCLNTQQGFAAGAEDQDSSADEADDVEAGPQSLPGAAGSDEDEDEYKVGGVLVVWGLAVLDPSTSPASLASAWESSPGLLCGKRLRAHTPAEKGNSSVAVRQAERKTE